MTASKEFLKIKEYFTDRLFCIKSSKYINHAATDMNVLRMIKTRQNCLLHFIFWEKQATEFLTTKKVPI